MAKSSQPESLIDSEMGLCRVIPGTFAGKRSDLAVAASLIRQSLMLLIAF